MAVSFFKEILNTINNAKQNLDHYCMISRQLVKHNKSCIQLSNDISNADRKMIFQILQIPISNKTETYLGCTNIDKNIRTTKDFDSIRRKLSQKLTGGKPGPSHRRGSCTY